MSQLTVQTLEAASELTDKQKLMVDSIVSDGMSKADAIRNAGYEHLSAGYAALRKPHVREYLMGLVRDTLAEGSAMALSTILDLVGNARSEYVRLEASKDILDRAGFKPVEKHAHLHGGQVSIKIDLT